MSAAVLNPLPPVDTHKKCTHQNRFFVQMQVRLKYIFVSSLLSDKTSKVFRIIAKSGMKMKEFWAFCWWALVSQSKSQQLRLIDWAKHARTWQQSCSKSRLLTGQATQGARHVQRWPASGTMILWRVWSTRGLKTSCFTSLRQRVQVQRRKPPLQHQMSKKVCSKH